MYLEYFNLKSNPFTLIPDTKFFCDLSTHCDAIKIIKHCIENGEGFIKIIGEVGLGKTILCRKIIGLFDENYLVCYLPDPDLSPESLRVEIASKLGINISESENQHILINEIKSKLYELAQNRTKTIILVDEAQAMNDNTLEALRLITNIDDGEDKYLFVILVGQPELDQRLLVSHLRQLRQRITVNYYLESLSPTETDAYISRRLIVAGHKHGIIFTKKARNYLVKISRGVPRILNILCNKSLLVAYNDSNTFVNKSHVKVAEKETKAILDTVRYTKLSSKSNKYLNPIFIGIEITLVLCLLTALYFSF